MERSELNGRFFDCRLVNLFLRDTCDEERIQQIVQEFFDVSVISLLSEELLFCLDGCCAGQSVKEYLRGGIASRLTLLYSTLSSIRIRWPRRLLDELTASQHQKKTLCSISSVIGLANYAALGIGFVAHPTNLPSLKFFFCLRALLMARSIPEKLFRLRSFYMGIITKTIRIGCDVKTVNDAFRFELIPQWEVQQAYQIGKLKMNENEWFSLSQKLNGVRGTYFEEKLISRQGKEFNGLDHILAALHQCRYGSAECKALARGTK